MAALNSIRRRWKLASGQELIEFALVLPLLLLVLLGIIEFGLLFQQYEVVTNAAREGARIAVLPTYTKADALTRINQYLTAGPPRSWIGHVERQQSQSNAHRRQLYVSPCRWT